MHGVFRNLSYKIGASSMVFGHDLVENAGLLAPIVDHVEIVLFHTAALNNIPGRDAIRSLNEIGRKHATTYSVHLPAMLEIGARSELRRKEDIRLIRDICFRMADLNPIHYVLHIPFSPPTLVPVPGFYFYSNDAEKLEGFTARSLESLAVIKELTPKSSRFLVENINYSPSFLEKFIETGLCGLCLDIGHLVLGGEPVADILEKTIPVIEEIHIHGVKGYEDHLCVSRLPKGILSSCLRCLAENDFGGVLNLEVFTPEDLNGSLLAIRKTLEKMRPRHRESTPFKASESRE